jgi:hypothetical protein
MLIPDVYLYGHLDTSRVHNVRTLCAELSSTKKDERCIVRRLYKSLWLAFLVLFQFTIFL